MPSNRVLYPPRFHRLRHLRLPFEQVRFLGHLDLRAEAVVCSKVVAALAAKARDCASCEHARVSGRACTYTFRASCRGWLVRRGLEKTAADEGTHVWSRGGRTAAAADGCAAIVRHGSKIWGGCVDVTELMRAVEVQI